MSATTVNTATVALAGYLAQAAYAVAIAIVLAGFHRHYHRQYLRHWASSWWALCLYYAGAAALNLEPLGSPLSPFRVAVSIVALIGGYWQIAWLLFGTYEVATGREVPRRRVRWLLVSLALVALITVAASAMLAPEARLLARLGLRSFGAGLAFLVAGLGVLRSGLHPAGLGRRLVGGAFLLYAIVQLAYAGLLAASVVANQSFPHLALIFPFDFFLQTLMGLGMVIWLLEEERTRAYLASEQIAHLAYYDPLTELANRNLFHEHLRLAIARIGGSGLGVAVFLLDLDRFKSINDSLGHRAGDGLLRLVAERLRGSLRPGDTIARLGGDEFAVLLPAVAGERDMVRLAEKVVAGLRRPFSLGGRDVVVTASLGISRYPDDGADAEELLKKADVAMYQAKLRGRDGLQLYAAVMDANALDCLSLENDLRKALAQGELMLLYQPVLDAASGRIEGVEALLRWQHPVRGLLQPADFLWIAELSGLSNPIDLWVLGTACRDAQSWHDQGADWLRIAVNLSARPFQRSDLIERVKDVLWETGLPSSCLELEITETLAMQNAEESLGVLRSLKELGVRVAIDDFGTGYSSLSYLRNFPIDTLKIDASFIRSLTGGGGSLEIASAMIALAHSLNIRVVAEGVEAEGQWRILRDQGCDEVQGYYFSPPLTAADCRQLLQGSRHLSPPREDGAARSAVSQR
ncbi:MAG TPA: EAL domain-containing protein [Thermoanaerobaculia bacterium]|nr:EAL domain-containing protein [Thermoanaerobaculia bacterium]